MQLLLSNWQNFYFIKMYSSFLQFVHCFVKGLTKKVNTSNKKIPQKKFCHQSGNIAIVFLLTKNFRNFFNGEFVSFVAQVYSECFQLLFFNCLFQNVLPRTADIKNNHLRKVYVLVKPSGWTAATLLHLHDSFPVRWWLYSNSRS